MLRCKTMVDIAFSLLALAGVSLLPQPPLYGSILVSSRSWARWGTDFDQDPIVFEVAVQARSSRKDARLNRITQSDEQGTMPSGGLVGVATIATHSRRSTSVAPAAITIQHAIPHLLTHTP